MTFKDTVSKISELTEVNDHTTALIMGAKLLPKTEVIVLSLEAMTKEHMRVGYLSEELNTLRYSTYKDVMARAKRVFSKADFDLFYDAF